MYTYRPQTRLLVSCSSAATMQPPLRLTHRVNAQSLHLATIAQVDISQVGQGKKLVFTLLKPDQKLWFLQKFKLLYSPF